MYRFFSAFSDSSGRPTLGGWFIYGFFLALIAFIIFLIIIGILMHSYRKLLKSCCVDVIADIVGVKKIRYDSLDDTELVGYKHVYVTYKYQMGHGIYTKVIKTKEPRRVGNTENIRVNPENPENILTKDNCSFPFLIKLFKISMWVDIAFGVSMLIAFVLWVNFA